MNNEYREMQNKKMESLTPVEIVKVLDKYIIGQDKAKKSVAIALRNRWRRQNVSPEMQDEIIPNNIIMIGPTGVGKTEIARRLSNLASAPFIKVEASKFTEVGYVGRDVESMVRELMDLAFNEVKSEMIKKVQDSARELAIEKVLDILQPPSKKFPPDIQNDLIDEKNKVKLRQQIKAGQLDDQEITITEEDSPFPQIEVFSNLGMENLDQNISEMVANIIPFGKKEQNRKMTVAEALKVFAGKEANKLVSKEKIIEEAKYRVENHGIIFIDEIDKIASTDKKSTADVSRSGVQRDLLPIVEGSSVPTKYGIVNTAHILFIAAGAFHISKPSDLIPELQGRFPIRVELNSLSKDDFEKILRIPQNALLKQYEELFSTEKVRLSFDEEAVSKIAEYAAVANEKMEDIGARRLQTILNAILEEYLFEMPKKGLKKVVISSKLVDQKVSHLLEDEDLSKFIL